MAHLKIIILCIFTAAKKHLAHLLSDSLNDDPITYVSIQRDRIWQNLATGKNLKVW